MEAVNKEFIGVYGISRYYSPMPGQSSYYLNRSYEKDKEMNCWHGDCLDTANGYILKPEDAHKVIACPSNFDFWTRFFIEDIWEVVCYDRGGAIKNKRLDLWAWIGEEWLDNVYKYARLYAGQKKVYLIK